MPGTPPDEAGLSRVLANVVFEARGLWQIGVAPVGLSLLLPQRELNAPADGRPISNQAYRPDAEPTPPGPGVGVGPAIVRVSHLPSDRVGVGGPGASPPAAATNDAGISDDADRTWG